MPARIFEFDCVLGGCVTLNCEVSVLFGDPHPSTLKVQHNGNNFDCDGIILDYSCEFIPLTEYLLKFAKQEIKNGG